VGNAHPTQPAILIMKPILVFPSPSAMETPKSVFWKPTDGGLSKNRFL